MKRRRFLSGLTVGLAAGAGCLGDESAGDGDARSGPSTDGGESESARGTPTPLDGGTSTTGTGGTTTGSVDVADVAVVPELAILLDDAYRVYGERSEQFVAAAVDTAGSAGPAVEEFALVADGETRHAGVGYNYGSLFDYGARYDGDDRSEGWIAIRAPKPLATEDVRLTWPGGERPIGNANRTELARESTSFAVTAVDVPEEATFGETITASVTVENTGDVDGTFVGAIDKSGPLVAYEPVAARRLDVPAGETATWDVPIEIDDEPSETERPMDVSLKWRGEAHRREVTVRPGSAATPD